MLIALDIDDTLYLERDYVRSGFRAVADWLRARGHNLDFEKAAWGEFEQGLRGTIFDRVLHDAGIEDSESVASMVDVYRSHAPAIALAPDAERFLRVHSRHELAVISDGPAASQERKIDALGLRSFIRTFILTDRWGQQFRKPHERAFREVMGARASGECIYLGDNPDKDFAAPQALGWQRSIRVCRAGSLHELKPAPPGQREVTSLDDVRL